MDAHATRARPGAAELLKHPLARAVRYGGIGLLILVGLLLPQFETLPSRLIEYATVLVFLMVAVSATVLTGWAGQLSLGQFAFVAVGAYLTAYYGKEMGFLPVDGTRRALGRPHRDRDRDPRRCASAVSTSGSSRSASRWS